MNDCPLAGGTPWKVSLKAQSIHDSAVMPDREPPLYVTFTFLSSSIMVDGFFAELRRFLSIICESPSRMSEQSAYVATDMLSKESGVPA